MKQMDDMMKAVFTKAAPQHVLQFVSFCIAAAIRGALCYASVLIYAVIFSKYGWKRGGFPRQCSVEMYVQRL